jgi:hypothetical protein
LLALTFTSSGWAAGHYVEVWNPPEARTQAAHAPAARVAANAPAARTPDARSMPAAHADATHRAAPAKPAAKHKQPRHVAQAVKARTHGPATDAPAARPPAHHASGKLTVMQPPAPEAQALEYADIPRQFTPDGNVLRVGARNGSAKVTQ